MPLTPWFTQVSMIGFWTSAVPRSGWRNCNSTAKSCAAFLAPASHRSQNGSVQLVTIAILGLVEPPRLHAGRQATPTPTAATRARRRNRDTAAPAFGERIGE